MSAVSTEAPSVAPSSSPSLTSPIPRSPGASCDEQQTRCTHRGERVHAGQALVDYREDGEHRRGRRKRQPVRDEAELEVNGRQPDESLKACADRIHGGV